MRDEPWVAYGAVLTVGLAIVPLTQPGSESTLFSALTLLPLWTMAAFAMALAITLPAIFRMMLSGVESPLAITIAWLRKERSRLLLVFAGVLLCGLNMIVFMWTKPALNALVPFWADPMLAGIDRAIFGFDPAFKPAFLNTDGFALFYHRGWFAMMIAALILVLFQPPSPRKNALLVTYFLLWSLAGPLVHTMLPAAGPIFYERLGYGARFAGESAPQTARLAEYLWGIYGTSTFGPAAGISAMPSLHIATTAWVVMAVWLFARRWLALASAAGLLILILSVSLGWHYYVDGLVGAALALGCYSMCLRSFSRRLRESISSEELETFAQSGVPS